MDFLDLPYKTTFAAQIRAIQPSEDEIKEATASLNDLKNLLPAGIDPEQNPQLLYIAANLYVAGMVNLNDDGVDYVTSLAAYKGFEKQQLNIEHDRKRIAGYILHAGLSEFGSDKIITEDEARLSNKPFNISVVAALWRVANKELCAYLEEASSPLHPEYKQLSLSFEVGFSSYNIGVIDSSSRMITNAKRIIVPSDEDFGAMSKRLRSNGGSGRLTADASSDGVYQILTGTFMPLGGGIVTMPAAAVKGITVISEVPDNNKDENKEEVIKSQDKADFDEYGEIDELGEKIKADNKKAMESVQSKLMEAITLFDKKSISRIISTQTSVLPITSQTKTYSMKSLKEVKEALASAQKPEDFQQAAASVFEIAEAISKASEELATQLEAEKTRSAEIERNRAEALSANEALKTEFAAVQAEVAELRATQLAVESEALFNERMAEIEEIFELDDDSRAFFAKVAKKNDSDDSDDDDDDDVKNEKDDKKKKNLRFKKKMAKMQKLMPEKTKANKKKALQDKQKKSDELMAALKAKGVSVVVDENDLIKEVIASAQENNISTEVRNIIEGTASLRELIAQEFAENVSIGGKKLSDLMKKE